MAVEPMQEVRRQGPAWVQVAVSAGLLTRLQGEAATWYEGLYLGSVYPDLALTKIGEPGPDQRSDDVLEGRSLGDLLTVVRRRLVMFGNLNPGAWKASVRPGQEIQRFLDDVIGWGRIPSAMSAARVRDAFEILYLVWVQR